MVFTVGTDVSAMSVGYGDAMSCLSVLVAELSRRCNVENTQYEKNKNSHFDGFVLNKKRNETGWDGSAMRRNLLTSRKRKFEATARFGVY